MRLKKTVIVLVLTLLVTKIAFAEDISIIGSIPHTLNLAKQSRLYSKNSKQTIQLLHIQLTDEEKKFLQNRAKDALTHSNQFLLTSLNFDNSSTPEKIKLGMNNVPVLNQGPHGTCVTFAVTGALDAVIAKGDYISQLCNLVLGNYLEKQGHGSSGWNGSYASRVINQITEFGIVNSENQNKFGCGGIKNYPTYDSDTPDSFIEPEKFYPLSELIFGKVANWFNVFKRHDSVKTFAEVKQALNEGDRLIFAVMLPRTDLGTAGAVGRYKTWIDEDTWVLTSAILGSAHEAKAGHEMIITGYDDNAIAYDDKGEKHKGLLILRNSWGNWAGNYGEFYMSYDYFKLLSFDLQRITAI